MVDSDSESDGNDTDKRDTERDLIQSQPGTAGSLHQQFESPELTESAVATAHEYTDAATEGSMPELAFSQIASSHTDVV